LLSASGDVLALGRQRCYLYCHLYEWLVVSGRETGQKCSLSTTLHSRMGGELTSLKALVFTRTWLCYVWVFATANPSVSLSSVCLSEMLVHPIQEVKAFSNIYSPLSTLAILW